MCGVLVVCLLCLFVCFCAGLPCRVGVDAVACLFVVVVLCLFYD